MSVLVSIIIPLYNAERHIAEAITSAINQTWANKEIIVVDDGSTDNSLAIAKTFEGGNIKVISQTNQGASSARNKGLSIAAGDYIQFLDGDDLLDNRKIEQQLHQLATYPDYICCGPTIHFFDGEKPDASAATHEWYANGSADPVDFLIKLYGGAAIGKVYGGMITVHAWLCPRAIINKAGLWNEKLTVDDDGEFFCRVILASKGIKYAPGAINFYRKFTNANTLSSQTSFKACQSLLRSTDLKTKHLLTVTSDERVQLAMSRVYWEICLNFYPKYKQLAADAERKARELLPGKPHQIYHNGIKEKLSLLFGWRFVKQLQYLKHYSFFNNQI